MAQAKMKSEERQKLITTIASLYQFASGGERSRRRLIDEAGLATILSNVELVGPAGDVAWDIVQRLERYGKLADPPKHHALGALLKHLLTLNDLPQDEAHFTASLAVKYRLLADAPYLEELRIRYGITAADGAASPPTGLTESQRQQLQVALISAFPPQGALAQMVNARLHEDLAAIAPGGTLETVAAELITWAETGHRVEELIRRARAHNPTDPLLRAFAEQVLLSRPVPPPDV